MRDDELPGLRDEDLAALRVVRLLAAVTAVVLAVAFLTLMLIVGRPAVLAVATFLAFGLVYAVYRVVEARIERRDATPPPGPGVTEP